MSDSYAAIPALNWSSLKLLHTSPLLARYRRDVPTPDSPAFALGRAVHCAVLEPDRFEHEYCVMPDFGDLRTKAGKASRDQWYLDAPVGIQCLSARDYADCVGMRDALRSRADVRHHLSTGRPEVTMEWTSDGVACKGRADWLTGRLVELKTTRRDTLRRVLLDAADYLYHGQLAWYHDGAIAAGLIPPDAPPPVMLVVQSAAPYDTAVLDVGPGVLAEGRALCASLLARWRVCQEADFWPGMCPGRESWDELPRWAQASDDDGGAP